METLVAVAVLVILMGITFVPLASLANDLKMTQLDNYAKSIYQAAQNRLVSMKASGTLVELQTTVATHNSGQKLTAAPSDYAGDSGTGENWKNLYYITSSDTDADALIMQAAVISQGIISGGSYIIEMDPVSGEVYGVFYSDSPGLTYEQACAQGRDRASREAAKIGYYGGFSTSLSPDDLPKVFEPVVKFVNHEELYANIDCPGLAAAVLVQENLTVDITLTGASGGTWTTQLVGGRDFDLTISQTTIQMIVDSTRTGFSFASITGNQIAPGDDVDIAVSITYDDHAGRRVITETPGTDKANSLFGSIVPDAATGTTTINVSSVRHLNNLHSAAYSMADAAREAAGNLIIAQTANIDFDASTWKYDTDDINDNAISQISYAANGGAVINPLSAISPIDNAILLNKSKSNNSGGHGNNKTMAGAAINGAGFTVSNFVVTSGGEGGTGLFAATDGAMSDIHLINTRVTGGNNTGTLVGAHYGGAVSNCTVVDPIVTGGSNTGGLIGSCKSTEISGCSVRLSDIDANGARRGNMNDRVNAYTVGVSGECDNIGGLIGYVEDNDNNEAGTTVRDSFAAINVNAGSSGYVAGFIGRIDTGNANALSKQSSVTNCYASGDVTGYSFTAGFVGYLGRRVNIDGCYTTSNVTGWLYSAGFAARPESLLQVAFGNIKNSESYGRVLRPDGTTDPHGAFGFSSGWPSNYGNRFLNQRGYNDADALYYQWAADSYEDLYVSGNATVDCHPYSDTLASHKSDGYAFPFEMCTGLPHYGNWPEFNAIQYNVANGLTGFSIAQNGASTYYAVLPYGEYRIDDYHAVEHLSGFGVWLNSAGGAYYPVQMTLTMQKDNNGNVTRPNTPLSVLVNARDNDGKYSTSPNNGLNYAAVLDGAPSYAAGTELTVSVAPATYNAEWLDGDGETLKVESVYYGSNPGSYTVTNADDIPSKKADGDMAYKSYCFDLTNSWGDTKLSVENGILTQAVTAQFKIVDWEQQMLDMMSYDNPSLWQSTRNSYYGRNGLIYNGLERLGSGNYRLRLTATNKMDSQGIGPRRQGSMSAVMWDYDYLALGDGVSPQSNSFRMFITPWAIVLPSQTTDADVYPKGYDASGNVVPTRVGEMTGGGSSEGEYEKNYCLYWGEKITEDKVGREVNVIVYDLGRAAHSTVDNPLPAWRKARVTVGYNKIRDINILTYYTGDDSNPNTLVYTSDWYDYIPSETS